MKMKNKLIGFVLVCGFTLGSSSIVLAGRDSGGGNSIRSKPIDVEFEASGAASNVASLLSDKPYGGGESTLRGLGDVKADAMAARIRSKIDLESVSKGTAYKFVQGPCWDNGVPTMGSAVIGDSAQPFCLSVSELARLPENALLEQIAGVMVHELAHQAGYEETDAKYLQSKVVKRLKRYWKYNDSRRHSSDAESLAFQTQRLLENEALAHRACAKLGKLDAYLELVELSTFSSQRDFSKAAADELRQRGRAAIEVKFAAYCDSDAASLPSEQIIRELQEVSSNLKALRILWSN
jgi:hypothetical protein